MIMTQNNFQMPAKLLQPWSTFVLVTTLPSLILEKMIRITDEIVEDRSAGNAHLEAGQVEDQLVIDLEILEREELMSFFLDVCKSYVVQAFCQTLPFEKEKIVKVEWLTQLTSMWINSQKDHEYFPIHIHDGHLSSVMYLKIPEYLPNRKVYKYDQNNDGAVSFTNNVARDQVWGTPTLTIQPKVGDFFIFPASQQHQVYPFRTPDGKGERRSVSFNALFSNKKVEEFRNNIPNKVEEIFKKSTEKGINDNDKKCSI